MSQFKEHVVIVDDEGVEHVLPSRLKICPRCRGKGQHDHPAFSNGITGDEWAEWDEDSQRDYLSGAYDVVCEECHGHRVVPVADEDRMTPEQIAMLHAHLDDMAELRAWERSEAMRGC